MVGAGSANKAVARQLAVTAKTVQFHLGNIYRKLGVGSRSELAHLVGAGSKLLVVSDHAGNLPVSATTFVGRDAELEALVDLMRDHRLVTVTGPGGVGKTRLAVRAAERFPEQWRDEFTDGVWLAELASVTDPRSVPEVLARTLGVVAQPGSTVSVALIEALRARRPLLVVDNCEHVLDAVAELIGAVLARSSTVWVVATSREALGVSGEQLLPLRPFETNGVGSVAVRLFVERARGVSPNFSLDQPASAEAVEEICQRVDGIALAIELAAAQMNTMTAMDLCGRLTGSAWRPSGRSRDVARHRSVRDAMAWSFDLLDRQARAVLDRCSVFAGGFDAKAAIAVAAAPSDRDADVIDVLGSLVRKSLVTFEPHLGTGRYSLLEPIRQLAYAELSDGGEVVATRVRHARHFADEVSGSGAAEGFIDVELANLRAAFRSSLEIGDVTTAAQIAVRTSPGAFLLEQYEPIRWAEELIEAAVAADTSQLTALYVTASGCMWLGRPETALDYLRAARALAGDVRYEPVDEVIAGNHEATAHLFAGRPERSVEIGAVPADKPGLSRVVGLCTMLFGLPEAGRFDEAELLGDETVAAARTLGHPFYVSYALCGFARVFARTDPGRALEAVREALAVARTHNMRAAETVIARDAARLEMIDGDADSALELFAFVIDRFHRAGDRTNLVVALAELTILFGRLGLFGAAATIYGTVATEPAITRAIELPPVLAQLRDELGEAAFNHCVAAGAALEPPDAIQEALSVIMVVAVL